MKQWRCLRKWCAGAALTVRRQTDGRIRTGISEQELLGQIFPQKVLRPDAGQLGQTTIADSRFVFITLIMSNKRGEQYFIDNFRAGLEPTQGKNYKTSPKWPGAGSDQPGSNCYDHEIVSRNREKYFQIKLTPPPASLATKPKPL